jgi:hypothetical protein
MGIFEVVIMNLYGKWVTVDRLRSAAAATGVAEGLIRQGIYARVVVC